MQFDNIPTELRQWPQWVCWRYEDQGGIKPTKVPYNPANGSKASHSDPFTWNAFDYCVNAAKQGAYSGIGFVLSERDPYAFIDLDDTYGDKEAADAQLRIFQAFNSYSEKSPSGRGLHIIVKGTLPSGRKRSHVEVYSNLRFMTMTGDVYANVPIAERNEMLNMLWGQMGGPANVVTYTGDDAAKFPDHEIVQRAMNAANGPKFTELLYGRWQSDYASQSEADFAFIDIVAFYTQNREQIVRLFRSSGLGQRAKAQRNDYVNYMVNRAFDRMLPPIDFDGLKNALEDAMAKPYVPVHPPIKNPFDQPKREERFETVPMPGLAPNTSQYATVSGVPIPRLREEQKIDKRRTYDPPAGLLGDIAQFIYAAAPRPVPEIALAGAIALLAGICGRAYNVSGMGLNQYIMLLAETGVGKEAIASGIDKLMKSIRLQVPAATEFIGPAEIASPEALLKYFNYGSSSFVSLLGEFGMRLKQMAALNAPPNLIGLRRLFLDLFNKSGQGKSLKKMIYSDKQKNTDEVDAPAFSMMGESTPGKFYEALNEGMISEGLLPRFTMIEYYGERPDLNHAHGSARPSDELVTQLAQLCGQSLQLNKANKAIDVGFDEKAAAMFDQFDRYCTGRINQSGSDDVRRQLWNRAHVKAMKLAALIAVGAHPYQPVITEVSGTWAINLVVTDTQNLLDRFESGSIGVAESSDGNQLLEIGRAISEYMLRPHDQVKKYHVPLAMHQARVIPYSYISRRLSASSAFRNDRMGSTNAIKKAVQALIERGDIQEVPRNEAGTRFKTTARCFMVANPQAFKLN